MIKLSKRLEAVAAYVPENSRLADVGSDHAYLPLFLVENGRIDFAVAGEVVQGPYQSALSNVAQAGKNQFIQVRLANGLAAVQKADAIDVVTIAGMGGRLIADILMADLGKLATIKRLILQPNNCEDELREWLAQHDFRIIAEEILIENQKNYEIMVAEHGRMTLSDLDRRFGPFLRREKTAAFATKWNRELQKLSLALEKIPTENTADRTELCRKIEAIKEVLYVS